MVLLIVWSIGVYRQILLLLLPLLSCFAIAQTSISLQLPKPIRIPACSGLLLWCAVCCSAAAAAACAAAAAAAAAALHLHAVHACCCW
jgi:hypothetical protein